MKLSSKICELRGVRAVRFVAVIPKSKKLKVDKRRQKTWTFETCAPEFTIKEMTPSVTAEAERWEKKILNAVTPPETSPVAPRQSSLPDPSVPAA